MANRRSLHKRISLSEQVNDLSLKAALLFTWAIPHLDDWGRMAGAPRAVKAAVVPLREDITTNDVAACLTELHEAGLIIWYAVDGQQYVQYPKFEAHQTNLHKRTASRLPPPPDLPGTSRSFTALPPQEKGREEKGTEGKVLAAAFADAPVRQTPAYREFERVCLDSALESWLTETAFQQLYRTATSVDGRCWDVLIEVAKESALSANGRPAPPRYGLKILTNLPGHVKTREQAAEHFGAGGSRDSPRANALAPASYDDGPPDDDNDPIAAKVRAQTAALARAAGHGA